jgi:hypothetical protein
VLTHGNRIVYNLSILTNEDPPKENKMKTAISTDTLVKTLAESAAPISLKELAAKFEVNTHTVKRALSKVTGLVTTTRKHPAGRGRPEFVFSVGTGAPEPVAAPDAPSVVLDVKDGEVTAVGTI